MIFPLASVGGGVEGVVVGSGVVVGAAVDGPVVLGGVVVGSAVVVVGASVAVEKGRKKNDGHIIITSAAFLDRFNPDASASEGKF